MKLFKNLKKCDAFDRRKTCIIQDVVAKFDSGASKPGDQGALAPPVNFIKSFTVGID